MAVKDFVRRFGLVLQPPDVMLGSSHLSHSLFSVVRVQFVAGFNANAALGIEVSASAYSF